MYFNAYYILYRAYNTNIEQIEHICTFWFVQSDWLGAFMYSALTSDICEIEIHVKVFAVSSN